MKKELLYVKVCRVLGKILWRSYLPIALQWLKIVMLQQKIHERIYWYCYGQMHKWDTYMYKVEREGL